MCILIDTLTRYQEYDDVFNPSIIAHNNDLIRIQNEYADIEDDCEIPTTSSNPTIKNSLIALFNAENIKTKQDLHKWNGNTGMKKLHYRIEQMAGHHYNRIKTPKSTISYCSQKLLSGYKIYKEKK
jgi:hypothetical protein